MSTSFLAYAEIYCECHEHMEYVMLTTGGMPLLLFVLKLQPLLCKLAHSYATHSACCMLHTVRIMCQYLYLLELGRVQLTPFITVIALDPGVLCYSSVA